MCLAPYWYVTWANIRVRVMLMFLCSLISSCGIMNSCSDVIECVVYVVSCVAMSLLPAIGYCGRTSSVVHLERQRNYLRRRELSYLKTGLEPTIEGSTYNICITERP